VGTQLFPGSHGRFGLRRCDWRGAAAGNRKSQSVLILAPDLQMEWSFAEAVICERMIDRPRLI